MRKLFIFVGLCWLLVACSPSPEVTLIHSLNTVASILRNNMDHPDTLIEQLNAYADANQETWMRMNREFQSMSKEDYMRIIEHKEDDMRVLMLMIMNLDLEFQDQIKHDAVRMAAYMSAINKVGILYSDGS